MSPRSWVPIQRPPSRSRSSLFELTSRSGISAFGLLALRIGCASTLLPTSCLSPAPLMPINSRPSSAFTRSSMRIPAVAYRFGGPGFHRQSPDSAPTQRVPELSSPKLQTNEPKAPSFNWHCELPLRIAHSRPVGVPGEPPSVPAHSVPARSSSSDVTNCPSSSGYRVSLPPFQLTSPTNVPIQRVPSRVTSRLYGALGSC